MLFKAAGALIEDQNRVAVMRVDAERRAGRMLLDREKALTQHARRFNGSTTSNGQPPPTYADLAARAGVTEAAFKGRAHRGQLIAKIPEAAYAREVETLRGKLRLI